MKKIFALLMMLAFCSSAFGQIIIKEKMDVNNLKDYSKNFRFLPEKPKAGDVVKISFSAVGTNIENAAAIAATYVSYSDQFNSFNSVEMKKNGDIWEAEIKTDKNTELLAFMLESDESYFTNNSQGYFVYMHDAAGNITNGAKLAFYAAKYIWGSRTIGLAVSTKGNPEEQKEINALIESMPNKKGSYINLLLRSTVRNRVDKDKLELMKIVDEYYANYAKTEDDYKNLIYGQTVLANQQRAKELFFEAVTRFPQSSYFAVNSQTQVIVKETDPAKQMDLLESIMKKYPDNVDAERYFSSYIHFLVKKNDSKKTLEFFTRFKNYLTSETAVSTSKNIEDDGLDPKISALKLELSKYAVDFAEREFTKPTMGRPEFASDKAYYQKKRSALIWAYINHGNLLYEKKKSEEALTYFDKMSKFMSVDTYKDLEMMTNYSAELANVKRFEEAEKIIDHAVKAEKVTSDMKETLKKIYLTKYGNEEKYKAYVASFEDKLMSRLKAEFKPKLTSLPAPSFTLKDLSGKTVSLSDYKGKIVILDFWATWCAPCQASFPGMQKAVDKFKSDNNIVFLFVNTSEKEEGIEKKIVKWQAVKKYTFHILLDTEYKIRDAYEARSIPNKLFIDRDGNIRYRAVGYSGGADKLVDEITAIISLINGE